MSRNIHRYPADHDELMRKAREEVDKDPMGPSKSGMTYEQFKVMLGEMFPGVEFKEDSEAPTDEK